jgi:hypothetical protein
MSDINWDDLDFGFDKTGQAELDDYLRYNETPINFPSTGNTNYGDVDPPSTGIGGPRTSYTQNPDGTVTVNPDTGGGDDTTPTSGLPSDLPSGLSNIFNSLFGDGKGGLDLLKLGAMGGGLAGLLGGNKSSSTPSGYQGGIPQYTATRNMVTAPEAGRRPGAGGTRYGGDVSFTPKGQAPTGGGLGSLIGGVPVDTPPNIAPPGPSGQPIGQPKNPKEVLPREPDGGIIEETYRPFLADRPFLGLPEVAPRAPDNYIVEDNMLRFDDLMRDPMLSGLMRDPNSNTSTRVTPKEVNTPPEPMRGPMRELMGVSNPRQYEQTFAEGGSTGRYLQGGTDGMADEIPAQIGEDQPAALSHGEFVIPADVVSHLGNGNSDAGAQRLYDMMDKIREARTGTKKQGKEINPDSFMPGGLAKAYAAGGSVKKFNTGGLSGIGTAANAGVTGTESTLSNWVGPYVTDMLGKGQALSEMPYQQYTGPLTAGASGLQTQAFGTAGNLSVPSSVGAAAQTAGDIAGKAQNMSYTPAQFGNQFQAPTPYQNTAFTSGTFGGEQAQQYMNPYLQQSLNPQLEEARRQSQITEQLNKAQMTKAGAFGGGRQAILTAENQRNLGTNLAGITGKGYDTAYQNAMSQFNQDQARNMQAQQASEQSKQFGAGQGMTAAQQAAQYGLSGQQAGEASRQFGANMGLQGLQTGLQAAQAQGNLGISGGQLGLANLQQQLAAGAAERGIESEGIAADKAAFEEARANPYKMVQYQQSLLSGLPLASQNINTAQPSTFQQVLGGAGSVASLLNTLGLGPKKG